MLRGARGAREGRHGFRGVEGWPPSHLSFAELRGRREAARAALSLSERAAESLEHLMG